MDTEIKINKIVSEFKGVHKKKNVCFWYNEQKNNTVCLNKNECPCECEGLKYYEE